MSKINPIRDEYMAHIEKQKHSGLSIKKYCELNNLIEHKLSYYRSYKINSNTKIPKQPFAEIKIKPNNTTKAVGINKIDPIWLAKFLNQLIVNK